MPASDTINSSDTHQQYNSKATTEEKYFDINLNDKDNNNEQKPKVFLDMKFATIILGIIALIVAIGAFLYSIVIGCSKDKETNSAEVPGFVGECYQKFCSEANKVAGTCKEKIEEIKETVSNGINLSSHLPFSNKEKSQ